VRAILLTHFLRDIEIYSNSFQEEHMAIAKRRERRFVKFELS
jgi:hypothetical protein